ncbi:MAG: cation diffusion facilitator family transporter [Clostridia bacterium]|nr:cation diffusion facilitator family transporter [Clostridia bacterium]
MKNDDELNRRSKAIKHVSLIGIIANLLLLTLKFIVGFMAKSQAMLADSLNSAGDIFASFMSYIGAKISSKPNDDDHPHGHGKAEYVFTQLISISMIVASVMMINSSIESIINKAQVEFSIWLVIVCVITIFTKFLLYLYTRVKGKKHNSLLIEASMEDHRNDMFVTLGTLIGIVGSYLGYYYIDGIIGIFISCWIAYVGFGLFKTSYKVLMDTNIDEEKQKDIENKVMEFEEILHVDSMISKPIGNKNIIILKVSMNGEMTINVSHDIAGKIKDKLIKEFDYIYDVIIHINPH